MAIESPVERRGDRARPPDRPPERQPGMRPLRRKPKQLDAEPTLFTPAGSGRGQVLTSSGNGGDRTAGPTSAPAGTAAGVAEEPARLVEGVPADGSPDPEALRRAQQIAARLAVPRARRDLTARRGIGDLASVRYRGTSDDIDLDASLEAIAGKPLPEEDDIVVRERVRTRRSVVLAVDVSGSMRGERVRTAAATVGALAAELTRDDLAVIAFWSDAAVLVGLGHRVAPASLLDTLLRIPARGLTNVSFPLQVAKRQLARIPARDARVLLLSDCVHNAGPDPRVAATGLARLDVLLDASGEHDTDLARDLARLGRGRLATIRTYRDVAPAVSSLFTD